MLDKLTYSGNPANLDGSGIELLVRRHLRRGCGGRGGRGLRGDRQLRGRDARRPLDPRGGRVHPDRTSPARRCCSTSRDARDPARARLDRRGLRRRARGRLVRRGRSAAPVEPYSGREGGGDLQVLGSVRTYGVDAVITRGANTYGPNQYPEKLLPLFITNALDGEPLPVYGDGKQTRDWLFVGRPRAGDRACARRGRAGEVYNVGGGRRRPNIEVTTRILGADRRRRVAHPPGRGPAGSRPPLLARHDEGARGSAGSRRTCSTRGPSLTVDVVCASTAPGGSRSSPRASSGSTTRSSTRRASAAQRSRHRRRDRAWARAVASVRERQSSFASVWRTCISTVRGLRTSSCAISALVRPTATRRRTSSSRRSDRRARARRPRAGPVGGRLLPQLFQDGRGAAANGFAPSLRKQR